MLRKESEIRARLAENLEEYNRRAAVYSDNCNREHKMSAKELEDHYNEGESLDRLIGEMDALRWMLCEID